MAAVADADSLVLHLVVPQPDGDIGGKDLHVLDLARYQLQAGPLAPLVVTGHSHDYRDRLAAAGIPTMFLERYSLHRVPWSVSQLAGIPSLRRVRLIHTHGFDANVIIAFLHLLYRRTWGKLPIVMSCHGWIEYNTMLRVEKWIDMRLLALADRVILSMPSLRSELPGLVRAPTIPVVNGVRVPAQVRSEEAAAALRQQLGLPPDSRLVAMVGRLSPEKRFDLYLETCAIIAARDPLARFLVVGTGIERAALEAQAAADPLLAARVIFTGMLLDVEPIYRGIDVYVHASGTDTTPRAVIEAMSYAVPVVATNVGGVNLEVTHGHTGYLVEKGDAPGLALYTLTLLQDPDLRENLGAAARDAVVEHFSLETMCESIARVYEGVLEERGRVGTRVIR